MGSHIFQQNQIWGSIWGPKTVRKCILSMDKKWTIWNIFCEYFKLKIMVGPKLFTLKKFLKIDIQDHVESKGIFIRPIEIEKVKWEVP